MAITLRRAGPTTCLGSMEEVALVVWEGRVGLEGVRVGELSLPVDSCNTWESGPDIFLGQHSRAVPGVGSRVELTLLLGRDGLTHLLPYGGMSTAVPSPVPLFLHQLQQMGELSLRA